MRAAATEILAGLTALGAKQVVMSDAADAVWIKCGAEISSLAVPALPHIEDVTGAGDALAGATLCALAHGQPLENAVGVGIKAAQQVMGFEGPYPPGDFAFLP